MLFTKVDLERDDILWLLISQAFQIDDDINP